MNILHVVTGLCKGCGGTSEVVPRLCRALNDVGHSVTIASLSALRFGISEETVRAIESGVTYEGSSIISPRLPWTLGYSPEFKTKIRPLIERADIVHVHGLGMFPPWCAGTMARKMGKPYVMMTHGYLSPVSLRTSWLKKKIVGVFVERPLLKRANALVATAESEARAMRAYGLRNPIHIMPIGLDCEKYRIKSRTDHKMSRAKTLLYFSRITPIKGLDMLAEVWSRIDRKGWKLLLVGPDDQGYTQEIKAAFAEKCPAGSYEFRGPVFGEAKYDLLASADALVLPSRSENWSIAVAEAMASGLPVVCTKGAPWSCLNTERAGYWVKVSAEGIEAALNGLFNLSDDERIKMGARGRAWVEENLSWDRIAREMTEFYEEVIRTGRC